MADARVCGDVWDEQDRRYEAPEQGPWPSSRLRVSERRACRRSGQYRSSVKPQQRSVGVRPGWLPLVGEEGMTSFVSQVAARLPDNEGMYPVSPR